MSVFVAACLIMGHVMRTRSSSVLISRRARERIIASARTSSSASRCRSAPTAPRPVREAPATAAAGPAVRGRLVERTVPVAAPGPASRPPTSTPSASEPPADGTTGDVSTPVEGLVGAASGDAAADLPTPDGNRDRRRGAVHGPTRWPRPGGRPGARQRDAGRPTPAATEARPGAHRHRRGPEQAAPGAPTTAASRADEPRRVAAGTVTTEQPSERVPVPEPIEATERGREPSSAGVGRGAAVAPTSYVPGAVEPRTCGHAGSRPRDRREPGVAARVAHASPRPRPRRRPRQRVTAVVTGASSAARLSSLRRLLGQLRVDADRARRRRPR